MNTEHDPVTGFTELSEENRTGTPTSTAFNEGKFYPSGAIAFFISLVILCLVIWFGIYFIMLDRV